MDDALRWYVRRTEQTEEEAAIRKKMGDLKEEHSEIQIAALIAVYLLYKTPTPKKALQQKTGCPLAYIADLLQVEYKKL